MKRLAYGRAWVLIVLGIVGAVYWPLHDAALVWDDKFYLHDRAWLREGGQWLQIAMHGFADWGIFFRPLGVALFTLESRLSDAAAAPMHLVSLGLHLLNTLLVGWLAHRLLRDANARSNRVPLACAAMVVYGLHPALTESVAWISSQCDLLVTLFTLLGLLANLTIHVRSRRTALVAACFFLAACAKESAVSFPLLLAITDWMRPVDAVKSRREILVVRVREQWPAYAAILLAGCLYLGLRLWGLGRLAVGDVPAVPSGAPLHLIAFTYLSYWKLLIWPMTGLNPMHEAPAFGAWGLLPFGIDAAALLLAATSLYLLLRRRPLGALMSGFSAALLPVLHIVPTAFDDSAFHERYATTAIAFACAFLPLAAAEVVRGRRFLRLALGLLGLVWLALAVANIRVILPLWADEVRLWKWTLQQNPGSIRAQDALLSTYVERNAVREARPLADALLQNGRDCAKCMLNVAFLALTEHDEQRAVTALGEARRAMDASAPNRALVMGYILATGNLSELQQRPEDAEQAYRAAIQLDPLSPEARMNLALLQARQGRLEEARRTEQEALSLSAADARTRRRAEFEQVLRESGEAEHAQP